MWSCVSTADGLWHTEVEREAPHFPVLALLEVGLKIESRDVRVTTVAVDALDHHLDVGFGEEFPAFVRVLREIDEENEAGYGDDDRQDPFPYEL